MPHIGTEAAADTTKQIITLSTGIIGLSVTFAEKFSTVEDAIEIPAPLYVSWVALGITIAFGVWTLMAITGEANRAAKAKDTPDSDKTPIRIPAFLMVIGFVIGIGCAIAAGFARFTGA